MTKRTSLAGCIAAVVFASSSAFSQGIEVFADYEVWAIDQSDSTADGGGTLYIYQGTDLTGADGSRARPEVIDLGGAARDFCLARTGSAPRRPHMMLFNPAETHAVIAWVATGHVLFLDTATRAPVGCVDVGVQAHAATPSPDSTYVIVANQNGKLLQRIRTDYAANRFTLEDAATLNLATCTTPSGAPCERADVRPDNAPICAIIESGGALSFVTLRGGGLLVVDNLPTPMRLVAEYDRNAVHGNGCGGVESLGKMYINSGGGTAGNPYESDVYAFPLNGFRSSANPPNTPMPKLIYSTDHRAAADSHGMTVTRPNRYIWVADRATNSVVAVDTATDLPVYEFPISSPESSDPAPDLLDISPDSRWVFAALRGPNPLTANVPSVNNAVGNTPGVGVIQVRENGRWGTLSAVARISRMVNNAEMADVHAIRVRIK